MNGFNNSDQFLEVKGINPGEFRYGKVITECDRFPGPGYNLVEKGSRWCFVADWGDEVAVEVVDAPEKKN